MSDREELEAFIHAHRVCSYGYVRPGLPNYSTHQFIHSDETDDSLEDSLRQIALTQLPNGPVPAAVLGQPAGGENTGLNWLIEEGLEGIPLVRLQTYRRATPIDASTGLYMETRIARMFLPSDDMMRLQSKTHWLLTHLGYVCHDAEGATDNDLAEQALYLATHEDLVQARTRNPHVLEPGSLSAR